MTIKRCDTCTHAVVFRMGPTDIKSHLDCRAIPPHFAIVPMVDPVSRQIGGAQSQIMPRAVPPDHFCSMWTQKLSVVQ